MEKVNIEGIVKEFEDKLEKITCAPIPYEAGDKIVPHMEDLATWLREKLTALITSLEKEVEVLEPRESAPSDNIIGYRDGRDDALSIIRSYKK